MSALKRRASQPLLPTHSAKNRRVENGSVHDSLVPATSLPSVPTLTGKWAALGRNIIDLTLETFFGTSTMPSSSSQASDASTSSSVPFPSTSSTSMSEAPATRTAPDGHAKLRRSSFNNVEPTPAGQYLNGVTITGGAPKHRRNSLSAASEDGPSTPVGQRSTSVSPRHWHSGGVNVGRHMQEHLRVQSSTSSRPGSATPGPSHQTRPNALTLTGPSRPTSQHVPSQHNPRHLQTSTSQPLPSRYTSRPESVAPGTPRIPSQTSDLARRLEGTRLRPPEPMVHRKRDKRVHILDKDHKRQIKENREKEIKEKMAELLKLKRSAGYDSTPQAFEEYVNYGAQLARMERIQPRDILSPSSSLMDLRSRNTEDARSRRHSSPEFEDSKVAFLNRALQIAKKTLNSPPPVQAFHPSLDQIEQWRRTKHLAVERMLRPPLPEKLPPDDEAAVDAMLSRRGTIAKFVREQVTDRDISRLRPGQWLNDEIINFYGQLILSRSEGSKENPGVNGVNGINGIHKPKGKARPKPLDVHYFNSFFWSKLTGEGYERARLAKWTKKFDIFKKDVLLIPVNHNNSHWTAAAINIRQKRIESYDSMGMFRGKVFKVLRGYLDEEHRNKKKTPFNFDGWTDWSPEDTPQQENGYDCGVFTCQFLESLSRGEESFRFTQQDMPYLRRRMIWEISNTRLREDA